MDEPSHSFDLQSIVDMAFDPKASLSSTYSRAASNIPRKPHCSAAPLKVNSMRLQPRHNIPNLKAASKSSVMMTPKSFNLDTGRSKASQTSSNGFTRAAKEAHVAESDFYIIEEEETPNKNCPLEASLSKKLTTRRTRNNEPIKRANTEQVFASKVLSTTIKLEEPAFEE